MADEGGRRGERGEPSGEPSYHGRNGFERLVIDELKAIRAAATHAVNTADHTEDELNELLHRFNRLVDRLGPAIGIYEEMVPLGLHEYLPALLRSARESVILQKVASKRWRRVTAWTAVISAIVVILGGILGMLAFFGVKFP